MKDISAPDRLSGGLCYDIIPQREPPPQPGAQRKGGSAVSSLRRLVPRLLAAALCLGLLIPPPAHAANIYVTSLNDNLSPLTADTMPVYSGGVMYVPYTVFDSGSSGIYLGVYTSYSRGTNTVTLFNLRQMLVFDLSAGTCRDDMTGEYLPARAIVRNNRPYVPAEMVCGFFGLTYSLSRLPYVTDGYLVRITSSAAALDDETFIDAGRNLISSRVREYNQSISPGPDTGSGEPDPGPEGGDTSPASVRTYLALRCESGEGLSGMLDALDSRGEYGLFLCTPETLEDDLLRRVIGSGHSVGILAEGASWEETQALLAEGSRVLERKFHLRTTVACVPAGQEAAAGEEGWICWRETMRLTPSDTVGASTFAANTLLRLTGRTRTTYLTLEGGENAARVLPALLRQLAYDNFAVDVPVETRL